MSVTFAPEYHTPTSYRIRCACGDTTSTVTFPSYEEAEENRDGTRLSCTDVFCSTDTRSVVDADADNTPELNVSNVNARHLLNTLGLPDAEITGSVAAEDMLGRILVAQAINPTDAGVPAQAMSAVMFDCGRDEGYTDRAMDSLRTVAEWAIANKRVIVWS